MAVLKCTVCGGELEVNAEMSVGVCKFCESTITIPKELDRKGNLYNRAIFLRQNNEFDKAEAAYEDILKQDNSDAEAHWGLVLSRFGIEYVSDPRTGERLPTCHRTQLSSILSDPDYLAALEFADPAAKRVIESEAHRIAEIQKRILEISQKEPPYDIFICYKESDQSGNRTVDSVLAQELYHELEKKNYKVFFARKTLESKLGTEYEPIIFAALQSAKVMIVLGTKPEHFTAVWVRNEWSRFLKLAQKDAKVIIPAYRNMSPYELPDELSSLQSQDMSKIGFMQDLLDGIERCTRHSVRAAADKTEMPAGVVDQSARLLKNGETYIKLGNYDAANDVYLTLTKDYPEVARGWWGLIVCKTRSFTDVLTDPSELNVWYGYIRQLAEPDDFASMESEYLAYTGKIAQALAAADMEQTREAMNSHRAHIGELQQTIEKVNKDIANCNAAYSQNTHRQQDAVSNVSAMIEKQHSAQTVRAFFLTIGVASLMIAAIMLLTTFYACMDNTDLGGGIGVVIGSAAITLPLGIVFTRLSKRHGSFADIQSRIDQGEAALVAIDAKGNTSKQVYEHDVAKCNNCIAAYQAEIAAYEAKIAQGEHYLSIGQARIATYWNEQLCAAFGMTATCDPMIRECRRAFYAPVGEASESAENAASPAQPPMQYRVQCPSCDGDVMLDAEQLGLGHCNCSHCGAPIAFKSTP